MVQLVHRNTPITIDEKATVVGLLNNKIMRGVMTDLLNEINSPKQMTN